jgi:hypothetical protein
MWVIDRKHAPSSGCKIIGFFHCNAADGMLEFARRRALVCAGVPSDTFDGGFP